jgi:hypothetical protein
VQIHSVIVLHSVLCIQHLKADGQRAAVALRTSTLSRPTACLQASLLLIITWLGTNVCHRQLTAQLIECGCLTRQTKRRLQAQRHRCDTQNMVLEIHLNCKEIS